jgi:hypothetical protein
MVLVVSNVKTLASEPEISVSDGWYSIRAQLDAPLQRMVKNRSIAVGQKFHIQCASIAGSADACPILEVPPSLCLKLYSNSTRRAKWDEQLGYKKYPNFVTSLGTVINDGGPIGCLDVIIARKYPAMYLERSPNGNITRNQLEEDEKVRDYEKRLDLAVQNAIRLMETTPEVFELSHRHDKEEAQRAIHDYAEMQVPPRSSTPVCMLQVRDYPVPGVDSDQCKTGMLTIYSKYDAFMEGFQEGMRFKLFNVTVASFCNGHIQLRYSTNSKCRNVKPDEKIARSLYSPRSLTNSSFFARLSGGSEIDTCLVILDCKPIGQFVDQKEYFKYLILCSDTMGEMAVIELTTFSDKTLFFKVSKGINLAFNNTSLYESSILLL